MAACYGGCLGFSSFSWALAGLEQQAVAKLEMEEEIRIEEGHSFSYFWGIHKVLPIVSPDFLGLLLGVFQWIRIHQERHVEPSQLLRTKSLGFLLSFLDFVLDHKRHVCISCGRNMRWRK